jgi:hypothetical protein
MIIFNMSLSILCTYFFKAAASVLSTDAGSNPVEVVEFLRTEKFRNKSSGRDVKVFDPCSKFIAR